MQLILRTCNEDLISHNLFQWKMGKNVAPDWDPVVECGNGLHGLLWGEGDGDLLNYFTTSKWLVGEIEEYVDLGGKVKFPSCNVIFIGNREEATQYLYHNSKDKVINGLIMKGKKLKGGDYCRLTGEDGSDIVVGEGAVITVGNNSTVEAGDYCTVTTGNGCTITVGMYCSVVCAITAMYNSDIKAGNNCIIKTGELSIVEAGNNSIIVYSGQTISVVTGTYLCKDGLIVPKQL